MSGIVPRSLQQVLPHFTCLSVPFDPATKQVAMMWRGENVRSAKNCASTPAGLLEHGEPFDQCLVRELQEELGILPANCTVNRFHTVYRNDNNDGLDWVIGVWSVVIHGIGEQLVNMEPDKHPALILASLEDLAAGTADAESVTWVGDRPASLASLKFAGGLKPVLQSVASDLLDTWA